MIPFLIVIVCFYCMNQVLHLSLRNSFVLLMVLSDIMALVSSLRVVLVCCLNFQQ